MENKKIKELNKAVRTLKEHCKGLGDTCRKCCFDKNRSCLLKNSIPANWEEVKEPIKITELEKQLLIHFKKQGAEYIARDEDKNVCLYKKKPFKTVEYGYWDDPTDEIIDLFILSELFSFVNWEDEEPTKINDVLENCAVVEE